MFLNQVVKLAREIETSSSKRVFRQISTKSMGPFLIKLIHQQSKREIKQMNDHYRDTAGFQDPDIPSSELRQLFQDGEIEL